MCGVFHHERPKSNNKYAKRRSTIPGGSLRVCTYKETASIKDCKIAITVPEALPNTSEFSSLRLNSLYIRGIV